MGLPVLSIIFKRRKEASFSFSSARNVPHELGLRWHFEISTYRYVPVAIKKFRVAFTRWHPWIQFVDDTILKHNEAIKNATVGLTAQ